MLDTSAGSVWVGFLAEERFLKRYVPWSVEGFVWHGEPAKVGQFIALMETAGCRPSAVLGTQAMGHDRRDADLELEGSVMKLAQRASVLRSPDGSWIVRRRSSLRVHVRAGREVVRWFLCPFPFVPLVALVVWCRCLFWGSLLQTATGPEIGRDTDHQRPVLEKLGNIALKVSHAPRQ